MKKKTPKYVLEKLPIKKEKVDALAILRQLSISTAALGELKGAANILPNQEILINAVVLQESKDSSEIENIITTSDELYMALSSIGSQPSSVKEVINYRSAIFKGFELIKKQGFLRLNDLMELQIYN
jgi:Fic family protein